MTRSEAYRALAMTFLSPPGEEGLRAEYHALFRVPGPRYVAPYESAYKDRVEVDGEAPVGALGGATTRKLAELYRVSGFEADPAVGDLPDSAGMELAFAACLAAEEKAREARGDGTGARRMREARRIFLEDHPGRWFQDLIARMAAVNAHPYFLDAAKAALAWLEAELGKREATRGRGEEPARARS